MRRSKSFLNWGAVIVACLVYVGAAVAEETREVVIKVDGMFCPFCTFGVEKRLRKLAETKEVSTDLAAGSAIVTLAPGAEFVEEHFADAIVRAGFVNSGITLRSKTEDSHAVAPGVGESVPKKEVVHGAIAQLHFVKAIGQTGSGPGEFRQPMSIAFSPEGWFVVNDAGNARVQQFSADGAFLRAWSLGGDGKTPLVNPVGLAIGANSEIWVSDYDADSISRYSSDGTPLAIFGRSGKDTGEFDAPSGLAVTADGHIAVADFFNHRIQLFSADGKFLSAIGAAGPLRRIWPSGLNYPTRVTAAANGGLWIADAYNHRVVLFTNRGKLRRRFGKQGSGPGQFDVSSGIALLPGGQLAVVDFMNHRIQIWKNDGTFVSAYGTNGQQVGQFERPTDVVRAEDGSLYVVDWGNDRIQVFTFGEAT